MNKLIDGYNAAPNFLAAYTAVNEERQKAIKAELFLAAYTAVNATAAAAYRAGVS